MYVSTYSLKNVARTDRFQHTYSAKAIRRDHRYINCCLLGAVMCHMDIPGLDALMNISATILLAFGMSMDAFAASIGKGATLHKPKFSEALRTGLIFGAIETLTPLIGWGLGMLASQFVLEWNHWIAFVLLVFLGGRMVIEGFRGNGDEDDAPLQRHGFWLLVTTAIATSLDAMAVGVGLAFLQVNIIATALAIGCATLIMSTLGMMVGRFIGPLLGKRAEILGGIVLIGIGAQILWAHFAG
ncbi:manganese efflux pump MntP [Enterobacter intestinihominis]|nr:Predicted membrane protein [Enterobacter hormaechei]VAF10698.1 putative sporulation protein YtaF [Enterobacter hormaechei]